MSPSSLFVFILSTITFIFALVLTPALADVFVTNIKICVTDEPYIWANTIKIIEPGIVVLGVKQINWEWIYYEISRTKYYIHLSDLNEGKLFRKSRNT